MATIATSAADQPNSSASSRRPWILLDADGCIGECPNGTTAEQFTSNKKSIKVSIRPDDPPAPSLLFVHCPDLDPNQSVEEARIVSSADCFLLLRVRIGYPTVGWREKGDYFVYRAETPSLRLLPKPRLPFHDDNVGFLPRGEHFTIAVLYFAMHGFDLHLFKSESWSWTTVSKVPLVSPQRPCPIEVPMNALRLNEHTTTTVITLGGEGGTMGWVDLWRGILFCDVLRTSPTLREVPLPLPRCLVEHGKGIDGCPKPYRGIAVVQGCLRMVELEVDVDGPPVRDPHTWDLNFGVRDWELSTYTNRKISGAWDDWQLDCTAKASHIDIDEAMKWKLHQSGLLHAKQERKLRNLHTSQPVLGLDNSGAVYLLAKVKFMESRAWALSVDIKGKKIQSLAEFSTDKAFGFSHAYCPSTISSYIDARATPVESSNKSLRCGIHGCTMEFTSEINFNRHKLSHAQTDELDFMENIGPISKYWDDLTCDQIRQILSSKETKIMGVNLKSLKCRLEGFKKDDPLAATVQKLINILKSSEKMTSSDMLAVLEKASEETCFSNDIQSCKDSQIFTVGGNKCTPDNDVAIMSYIIERQLVSSWLVHRTAETTRHAEELLQESNKSLRCGIHGCTMEFTSEINFNRHKLSHAQTDELDFKKDIDAITKYWDDLTCDQIRQILSIKGTKITGFNLKNLKRRLECFKQDHPLAATAQKLINILKSSENLTMTEMLAVLKKASEDTHFTNDIRSCKDDEICAVGDNKCTPANDVALMSYIIEMKLVEHWESVKNDTQRQLVPDPKSKKRESTEFKAGEADGAPTVQHILKPTSGILLDEFTRSNKLTKIYKIRPKDFFVVLKRSLKKLKKDFASKIPKKKLKAVFKLSCVILTRCGRKCARGFLLWIVKNHREGKSWNGSFQLSDMQVINGQFIISKEADMHLTLESASADFKSLWELLLVPFYTNSELGRHPLYFDEFGQDIFNLPDPVTDPDGFMKHEKYLALHFAFMPPLSRSTLLISLHKAYESNRLVKDHAFKPLNLQMSYDWRNNVVNLPVLTNVYYNPNANGQWNSYTSSFYHLLKFSRHYISHDLDHTKVPGVEQMVSDMMVTDLVLSQVLGASLSELVLFIVNHTNMEGRFFRAFQQFESSDDTVFFCIEDDLHDDSPDSELRF